MHDLTIPFTNNLAERAISFAQGHTENFCAIRSYSDTAPKQGFGMLHAMRAVFSGQALAVAQGCTVTKSEGVSNAQTIDGAFGFGH